jgi:hypothetical protein
VGEKDDTAGELTDYSGSSNSNCPRIRNRDVTVEIFLKGLYPYCTNAGSSKLAHASGINDKNTCWFNRLSVGPVR